MTILATIQAGRAGAPEYVALIVSATGGRVTSAVNAIAGACARHFPAYGMSGAALVGDYFAQTCNETGGYVLFEENLKYSVAAIRRCWPARFPTDASAAPFAWNPADADREDMALAAKVYGQRMGNLPANLDDDHIDDGWEYRGRGMLQLTGRANYAAYSAAAGVDLVKFPDKAADPAVSALIALEFYKRNGVIAALNAGDTDGARRITNVGNRYARDKSGALIKPIGLDHVNALRAKVLKAMGA